MDTDFSITSLNKAIAQLESGLHYCHSDLARNDPHGVGVHLRAAAIQEFEFTYELSWKTLKRYLKLTEASSAGLDDMIFPDLIRLGWERGLLRNSWKRWHEYRTARGTTSHTYDEDKAALVLELVPDFLQEAKYLARVLQERLAPSDMPA